MQTPLAAEQEKWVDTTLNSMTLPECVGQLLCPNIPRATTQDLVDLIKKIPL